MWDFNIIRDLQLQHVHLENRIGESTYHSLENYQGFENFLLYRAPPECGIVDTLVES